MGDGYVVPSRPLWLRHFPRERGQPGPLVAPGIPCDFASLIRVPFALRRGGWLVD